MNSTRTHKT